MGERRRERPWAVAVMRMLDAALGLPRWGLRRLRGLAFPGALWPPLPGAYLIGEINAPGAICTLADVGLMRELVSLPGVAIAGRAYTANLGIEKIVLNLTANPRVRFLVLCGKDSPLFRPGQSLKALCANGVSPEGRIIGAEGHVPVLGKAAAARVGRFRQQVELVDCIGETDRQVIAERLRVLLEQAPGPFPVMGQSANTPAQVVRALRPGGQREPIADDPKGYFVITVDPVRSEIVIQHHLPDNTPVHEMRGRSGQAMLRGLLREGLISQLSHAGYLGGELAKAEIALRLGMTYEQDRALGR